VKATFGDPNRRPQGKLVLGFRKEWLAELESHWSPTNCRAPRCFSNRWTAAALSKWCWDRPAPSGCASGTGLTVEDGLAEIIADDLLEDRGSAIAPDVADPADQDVDQGHRRELRASALQPELYQHLKRDGILLRDFLNQQIAAFRERYPEAVDSGLLLDIVALHTTPLGTANQCTRRAIAAAVRPSERQRCRTLLQQCQDLHLLTVAASTQKESTKTNTRLAHDTLAPLVRERFDESDKPGQRARRILDNRSVDWVIRAEVDELPSNFGRPFSSS
jgi:hypothetical protein